MIDSTGGHRGEAARRRALGRAVAILVTNTACAALYALLMGVERGPREVLHRFLVAFVYANVIGTAAHLVLPGLASRVAPRKGAGYWFLVGGILLATAAVGALVAGVIAAALGLFGSAPAGPAIRAGVGISIVLTLVVGLAITVYETTRSHLDVARETLRARELEAERAGRLASDARLASLESRLHPHFLFNAIAAIAGEVRESPEHAERLLIEFADLLRASLDSTQRHTVPLGDEVAIVRAYLEIEQARLGDRLRVKIDVPDDLAGWPVPPFALHTLAQNSVKHVAALRSAGAELRVDARRAGDRLVLSVWDDGPGLDLAAAPPGHGLENLRARLAVLYGGAAGLDAERADGGGRVTLSLPVRSALDSP